MVLVWLEGTEQYCVSCNNLVSSGCFGMIVCVCKLKTEQKILILRRKTYFIPSYVASFFRFNLSYILKKTNFDL